MRTETISLRGRPEVELTAYLLDPSSELRNAVLRPAVLVFPGGGYRGLSDREAEPVAMAYLAEGYQAFVLRYSVRTEFPEPLFDAEEALSVIRKRGAEWGVDPERIAAMDEMGIPFEAHIFQNGGHGLSLAKAHTSGGYRSNVNLRFAEWFALSVGWLREVLGDFSSDEDNSVPKARDTGRYGIDVAMGGMLARQECRAAILEFFPQLSDKKQAARASSYSLSIVNEALPVPHPADRMKELDRSLRQIALQ